MRRLRAFLAAAVAAAAAALAATAVPAAAQAPATPPPATMVPGVLTVGLNLPSDGFQVGAVSGTTVTFARGLEVGLAAAVGRRMGLPVQFVNVPVFSDIVAPGPKPFDLAFAQVSITSGRRQNVDFSAAYLDVDQGVLLRRGLATTPTTLAKLKPLQLCVLQKSTGAAVVASRVTPARAARTYPGVTPLFQALETGRCDAVVYDAPTLAVLAAEVPLRVGSMAGVIATGERYGAVLPDGSPLVKTVSTVVKGLIADGTVGRLQAKWLDVNLTTLRTLS
ncbi:MAG TPA: ABC transporter substrate-binding protein [Miltoncostaeaceae bacterium]|nr:ABC transporter substrate-binding protein [Miltoncostaeaceae bacterium]